ncbi:MAG TPA: vanadium-dependent haloperoxidase, partial [Pseudoxanthomonas sp.]|nr:vanadium-dependent haloperoxidase [Pseudoxanthomonas sp.]
SAEQTAVARFWEATLPPIYYGVVRSVADMPGRDVTRNARLYATVAQAMDDALIAVFDAKYHYGFWRPITAIRNGDNDGNGATERDASWVPFIDTPMHPEYPCAHCIVASAVGTVLKAELGDTPAPTLTTTSHTAGDAARSWSSIDAFVDEVSNARIWDGVHFRTSTEVGKAMGAKNSTARSAEQTAVARFWEATLPPIYYGVVRSVADMPGRDVTRNARLYATVAQAVDDALIAVFDAKYHYGFWRPITAIRNGDNDGNNATERDASWVPFIDTPMHPEYPCAHCIVASTVGTVLKAELGDTPPPRLTTTSYTSGDAARSWTSIDAFVDEVSNARIWDGVHFRNSTEVGKAMGRQVGELAAQRYLQAKP